MRRWGSRGPREPEGEVGRRPEKDRQPRAQEVWRGSSRWLRPLECRLSLPAPALDPRPHLCLQKGTVTQGC